MDGTILQQGSFIVPTTIVNQVVQIPANADFMWVTNFTRQGTVGGASAFGFKYYWQRGMPVGSALVEYYANGGAVVTGDRIPSGGFTLYDPSGQSQGALPLVGPAVATTASTNATRPVVSTGNTAGIAVGTIVRMSNTAQTDVNGVDMVVGAVTANTSFTLLTATNPLATAPGLIGGAGFYRILNYNALFYPRRRVVVNITQATNAQVSTAIPHGLTVGQEVRFLIPLVSGMTQLNSTAATNFIGAIILSVVDDYNFTINVDTTNYTAFTWPTSLPNQLPTSFPEVTPIGEDTATALVSTASQTPTIAGLQIFNTNTGILADSTVNTGFLGMILGTGGTGAISTTAITGPAGSVAADVVYWVAGKSTYGGL